MVDVPTVSIVIAATSVVAGVVYYAFQLRHMVKARDDMVKTRQMEILLRLYLTWGSDDMRKAVQCATALEDKYKDYDNFVKEYGIASQAWVDINKILWF